MFEVLFRSTSGDLYWTRIAGMVLESGWLDISPMTLVSTVDGKPTSRINPALFRNAKKQGIVDVARSNN